MMGVKLEKNGKAIRIYNHTKGTAILTFFKMTEEWYIELNEAFHDGVGIHEFTDVEMCFIYIWNTSISEVYKEVTKQNWWKDGKAVESDRIGVPYKNDQREEIG